MYHLHYTTVSKIAERKILCQDTQLPSLLFSAVTTTHRYAGKRIKVQDYALSTRVMFNNCVFPVVRILITFSILLCWQAQSTVGF